MTEDSSVLVTGASTGIGDRFAQRDHKLILVARDAARLTALAQKLTTQYGIAVEILPADLTDPVATEVGANHLPEDARIGVLVNNASMSPGGTFLSQTRADISRLVSLNLTASLTLAHAAAERVAAAEKGSIINVRLGPEFGLTVYGATKAFILYLSQGLYPELAKKGVSVQAVLPAATRTEIWQRSGVDINTLSGVMEVGDMVDAALAGYDRRESVTIPPLHNEALWTQHEQALQAMLPAFRQQHPAPCYLKS